MILLIRAASHAMVIICLLSVCLSGCLSVKYTNTSTGDFNAADRSENAIAEVAEESKKAAELIKLEKKSNPVDPTLVDYAHRHFRKADDIVYKHILKRREKSHAAKYNRFSEKRETVLKYTTRIEPSLVVIHADYASAMAFPHGEIFVTEPLLRAATIPGKDFSDALLGILIHELIHIRDGHTIEQWWTADGRKEVLTEKAYQQLADMTVLIPIFSYEYSKRLGLSFKAAQKISKLSEYAADLGVFYLMIINGLNANEYVNFLSDVNQREDRFGRDKGPPFSWLDSRCACLTVFDDYESIYNCPKVIIGSKDEGDDIAQSIDPAYAQKLARYFDDPFKLRQILSETYVLSDLSDFVVKALALWYIQKFAFTICAIQNAYPELPVKEGVLRTSSFDLEIFIQYF